MDMEYQLSRSNLTMGRAPVVEVVIPCGARDGGQGMTEREVGGDGVAVITICNPPVNSLSIDGGGTGKHGGGCGHGRRGCCGGAGVMGDGRPRRAMSFLLLSSSSASAAAARWVSSSLYLADDRPMIRSRRSTSSSARPSRSPASASQMLAYVVVPSRGPGQRIE